MFFSLFILMAAGMERGAVTGSNEE